MALKPSVFMVLGSKGLKKDYFFQFGMGKLSSNFQPSFYRGDVGCRGSITSYPLSRTYSDTFITHTHAHQNLTLNLKMIEHVFRGLQSQIPYDWCIIVELFGGSSRHFPASIRHFTVFDPPRPHDYFLWRCLLRDSCSN